MGLLSWTYLTIKASGYKECTLEEYQRYEKTRVDIEKKSSVLYNDYRNFNYSTAVDCREWLDTVIPTNCARVHSSTTVTNKAN